MGFVKPERYLETLIPSCVLQGDTIEYNFVGNEKTVLTHVNIVIVGGDWIHYQNLDKDTFKLILSPDNNVFDNGQSPALVYYTLEGEYKGEYFKSQQYGSYIHVENSPANINILTEQRIFNTNSEFNFVVKADRPNVTFIVDANLGDDSNITTHVDGQYLLLKGKTSAENVNGNINIQVEYFPNGQFSTKKVSNYTIPITIKNLLDGITTTNKEITLKQINAGRFHDMLSDNENEIFRLSIAGKIDKNIEVTIKKLLNALIYENTGIIYYFHRYYKSSDKNYIDLVISK